MSHNQFTHKITVKHYTDLAKAKGFMCLGPYTNYKTTQLWRCSENHEWRARYFDILKGHGCPYCCGVKQKTAADYENIAKDRGVIWIGVEAPSNVGTKTDWKCSGCSYQWQTRFNSIQQGQGCPRCSGNLKKTIDDYNTLAQDKKVVFVGEVQSTIRKKTDWRCLVCNSDLFTTYAAIRRGGCPKCKISKGEQIIVKILEANKINFESQKNFDDCRNPVSKYHLYFDFYLPDHNLLVEYDGEQHFRASFPRNDNIEAEKRFEGTKFRDILKNNYAKMKGIRLLRIPYTDFKNIEAILNGFLYK